jgi:hypothetical protein
VSSIGYAAIRTGQLQLDAQHPWPGPSAFTEQQSEYFHGRADKTEELFSCVKRERLTLLYGKSGLGKTSLLQAGLFPKLRAAALLPVYMRLSFADDAPSPDTQVKKALEAAIGSIDLSESSLPRPEESAWEYLHRREGSLIDHDGTLLMPVLVFDQFEEWFTLGARPDFANRLQQEFLPSLAALIENRKPEALMQELKQDREKARRLDLHAAAYKVLVTLREDYFPHLEAFATRVESLASPDNKMRLTEMNGRQALSVVGEPEVASDGGSMKLVEQEVAEMIVRFVAGAHAEIADPAHARTLEQLDVAPSILSLFCWRLNEERIARSLPQITRDLVEAQGTTIIDDFYHECVADMHNAVRRLIEDRLITRAGYRDNIDLDEARRSLEREGAVSSCIDELVRARLLQVEEYRGKPRLELTHDVLAEPVKKSRDRYEEEQAQVAKRLQEQELLAEAQRREAEAQRKADEARRHTRFLMGIAAAMMVLAVVAVWKWVAASRAEESANKMAVSAKAAQQIAEKAQRSAEEEAGKRRTAEAGLKQKNEELAHEADKESALAAEAKQAKAEAVKERNQKAEMLVSLKALSKPRLDDCIDKASKNDTQANQRPQEYEAVLVGDKGCFSLALEMHKAFPDDIDVTDSLSLVPLRAADSARKREDAAATKKYSGQAVDLVKNLRQEYTAHNHGATEAHRLDLIFTRTYMVAAYELISVKEVGGRDVADRAVAMLNSMPKPDFADAADWDRLADIHLYRGLYLLNLADLIKVSTAPSKADTADDKSISVAEAGETPLQALKRTHWGAVNALGRSFDAEMRAHDRKTGDDQYVKYAIRRGSYIGDYAVRIAATDCPGEPKTDSAVKTCRNQYYEAAALWLGKTLDAASRAGDTASQSDLYQRLARVEQARENWSQAAAWLNKSMSVARSSGDKKAQSDTLQQLSQTELAQNHFKEAVNYRSQQVKVLLDLYADHPEGVQTDLSSAYGGLAWEEVLAGDFTKAIDDANRGLAMDREQRWIYVNKAHALLFSGKTDDARQLYTELKGMLRNSKAKSGDTLFTDLKDDFEQLCNYSRSAPYLKNAAMDNIIQGLGLTRDSQTCKVTTLAASK